MPRRDLLRRHIRKHHPLFHLPASRSLKACEACRQRKEGCEGDSPCKACERRGVHCSLVDQTSSEEQQDRYASTLESPAASSMDDHVQSYFHYFHPEWPFLHSATFDPKTEPAVLVQSVIMVGMWAQGSQDTKNAAKALHRRLGSAIQSQRVSFQFHPAACMVLILF